MKRRIQYIIFAILSFGIILSVTPMSVLANIGNEISGWWEKYLGTDEQAMYDAAALMGKEELLAEIIGEEEKIKNLEDAIVLIPQLEALEEKESEFTGAELESLISSEETHDILKSVLINIYIQKGADNEYLLNLIKKHDVSSYVKTHIASNASFGANELSWIIENDIDDDAQIIAMKRLCIEDKEQAHKISSSLLEKEYSTLTDKDWIAVIRGLANYYYKVASEKMDERCYDGEEEIVINRLWELFYVTKNERLKDQIIYALAEIGKFSEYQKILYAEDIDDLVKISAIERNMNALRIAAEKADNLDELQVVIDSMKIYPINEIGDALKEFSSIHPESEAELQGIIQFIEAEGINGGFKYE